MSIADHGETMFLYLVRLGMNAVVILHVDASCGSDLFLFTRSVHTWDIGSCKAITLLTLISLVARNIVMFWSSNETPAKQEDRYAVPKTPGAAAWALKAVPTLFFGTPKPPKDCENDQIFADLTQDIKGSSSGKGVRYEEEQAPSTPNIFATRQQGGGGILKTPGTAGPAKNVSFAPGNSFDVSSIEESPTVRQKGKKIDRIRSGLPHNFPGKFPSPWTPRVIQPHDNDNHENNNNTDNEQDMFDLDEMKKLLTAIEQNNKILEKRVSKNDDEVLDAELIPKLRLQIEQAVDYARLRDKECLEHQAKRAEAMIEHTKLAKDYERLRKELDNESDRPKDSGGDNGSDEKLKQLEIENGEKSAEVEKLKEQIQELSVKLTMTEVEVNSGKSRDQEVAILNDQLREAENEVSRLRGESNSLKIDNEKLSQMNDQLETESSKLKHNQSQQASRDLEDAKRRIQQLESELDSGHKVTLESSRLQAELANTQRRFESEKEQLRSHYETQLNSLNARIQEHDSSIKERDERLTKLQASQSDLQGHVNLLREKIGKQNAEIERTNTMHTKEVNEKQDEIQRLRKEKQYLDDQLNGLIEQKATLTNQVSDLERQLRQQHQTPSIHAFNENRDSLLANNQKSYLGLYDSISSKPSDTKANPKPSIFNKPSSSSTQEKPTTKPSLFDSPHTQPDNIKPSTSDKKKPSLFDDLTPSSDKKPSLFDSAITKPSAFDNLSTNLQPEPKQTTRSASYNHSGKENQPTKLNFGSLPSQYTRAFSPAKSDTENLISLESSVDFKPQPEPSPMKDIETNNVVQSIRDVSMKDASYSSNSSGSILGDADREQASFRRLAERRRRNQLTK